MKEFLEYIVKYLVEYPDDVRINEVIAENTILYEVIVAESDMGSLIGKGGHHVNAIRDLLKAATKGVHKHVQLEILEPSE